MGFYLRKSLSVGPFRFNLSGSGVGVSVGVPGLRVGSGPRGNYVHLGRGGLYYRHTIPAGAASRTGDSFEELESASAAGIADSSSQALLEEIRTKRRRLSLRPPAAVFVVVGMILVLGSGGRGWALAAAAVAGIALIAAAGYRDRITKTVVVLYDFEPPAEDAFRRFSEWARALAESSRAWHVAAAGRVLDRKYHAGATALVQRNVTAIRHDAPPMFKTNVPVLRIGAGRQTLYFLPDILLIDDASGVGAVSYRTLELSVSRRRFVENGAVPSDATVVDHTWQYVNKSGAPDRRFSTNPQIPICLYDELTLRTPSGLHEVFQISRSGIGEGFAAAVRHLASVIP